MNEKCLINGREIPRRFYCIRYGVIVLVEIVHANDMEVAFKRSIIKNCSVPGVDKREEHDYYKKTFRKFVGAHHFISSYYSSIVSNELIRNLRQLEYDINKEAA